jgi:hypothetical protein
VLKNRYHMPFSGQKIGKKAIFGFEKYVVG